MERTLENEGVDAAVAACEVVVAAASAIIAAAAASAAANVVAKKVSSLGGERERLRGQTQSESRRS